MEPMNAIRLITVAIVLVVIGGQPLRLGMERDRDLQSQPQLQIRGNDGNPTSSFPLGLCEGDCDRNSDCEGDLVCFQRNPGEEVPGCRGGKSDTSRSDYCVRKNETPSAPVPPPSPAPQKNPNPTPTPVPPVPNPSPTPPVGSVKVKMYWEKGFFWQEERVERKYCLKCRDSGGPSCLPGNTLMIVECDNPNPINQAPTPPDNPSNPKQIPNRWKFISVGGFTQIQVDGRSTCLTRKDRTHLYLQSCDKNDDNQLFYASEGKFAWGEKFQVSGTKERNHKERKHH